jgi:DNA-directed RNA polymerase specialized sigma24 family protein
MALSFEEAFEAEFASLHRYLRRRVGASAADDLAAQTFLLLHAWAELSDSEIAAALSLPVGTVKSRLHRVGRRLRNRLGPERQIAVKASSSPVEE